MAKKAPKKATGKKKAKFSLNAPEAIEVILIGDFNQWNPKSHHMKSSGNGIWEKAIMLQPGRYEYKFLVDGQWQQDPNNDQVCRNCFGTHNNILVME